MKEFRKKYPKLYKYYRKNLKNFYKSQKEESVFLLDYMYTYFCMLRDEKILLYPDHKFFEDLDIVSLCSAIDQYESYLNCIFKYYEFTSNSVSRKDKEKTEEEVLTSFQTERSAHWNNFWDIVKQNIESWVQIGNII